MDVVGDVSIVFVLKNVFYFSELEEDNEALSEFSHKQLQSDAQSHLMMANQNPTTPATTRAFPTVTQSTIHSIVCDQLHPIIAQALGPSGQTCLFVQYVEQQQHSSSSGEDGSKYKIPQLTISRDGHSMLEHMKFVQHPVHALIKRMTRSVQVMAGDGTKSTVCIASSLLDEAYEMMKNDAIHPKTIAQLYQQLSKLSIERMKSSQYSINILTKEIDGMESVIELDHQALVSLASSVLNTRIEESLIENFANVCVTAIEKLYERKTVKQMKLEQEHSPNKQSSKMIDIICRFDVETYVQYFDGIVIDQGVRHLDMPRELHDCNIVFISEPLELSQRSASQHLNMQFHTAQQRVELVNAERNLINQKVKMIINSGAQVVISIGAIDATSLNMLAEHGIIALRHVKKETATKLAAACGVQFTHNIQRQLTPKTKDQWLAKIGSVQVHDDDSSSFTYFSGLKHRCSTIELYSSTKYTMSTLYHSLRNTLKVLQNAFEDGQLVPGGGSVDMLIASHIRSMANGDHFPDAISRKIAHSYANAIENAVPGNLCKNASFNICATLSEWRERVRDEQSFMTIDLYQYPVHFHNPKEIGLYDSLRVKIQSYHQSTDMVTALLDIDYMIMAGDLTSTNQPKREMEKHASQSEEHPTKQAQKWQYRRYVPKFNKDVSWSKHEKEAFRRREAKFYSKQERERRKKIEELEKAMSPSAVQDTSSTQRQQEEMERRKREMGLQGYNVDPFE